MRHSVAYTSVNVDVDIYIPDVLDYADEDMLVEEVRKRGYIVSKGVPVTDATAAFYAMRDGRLDEVRAFIADAAGRIA